ncbi:MAG: SPOR domain-containing protein [Bacteroidetes bacterium]|nr:SPOR domain-containing protein [Bacteroidota bacterium]
MKILIYLILFLFISSCGSSGSGRETGKTTGKEATDRLDVDWKATRTQIIDRDEPVIIGLDTTADWYQPKGNASTSKSKPGKEVKGYRIQLYSTTQRSKADEVATEAKSRYGLPAHITFAAPNYIVRVGNYQTQDEAKDALEKLISFYPNATLVPDFIRIQ